MVRLYHGRTSVCSVKTRLALAEKGVDWESQLLTLRGDQFDPAYLKLNPNAVVPTIVHDGTVIIESTVIMHYVNDAFPGPPLMAAEATSRAKVHMTTKLVDEYVHNACTVLTFATVNRPSLLQMKPEDPEAAVARPPSRARAEAKRQVAAHGLDAPLVVDALHYQETLLDRIDAAMKEGRVPHIRWQISPQLPMSGAWASSNSPECGTSVRALRLCTIPSRRGRRSPPPSTAG